MNWPDQPNDSPLGDGKYANLAIQPDTVDALRQAIARQQAAIGPESLAIYPQGGRTSLDYGGQPARPGIAVDLTRLNQVVDYPAADMTITVGAGITLGSLQCTLAQHHQRLPLESPHPERATLGGIFATSWYGPRRLRWGQPRDLILGMSFVTADGRLVKGGGRVVKNVAGYDLPRFLTGSLGTLGIITQMTLIVRPIPETSALAWFALPDTSSVSNALDLLATSSATRPCAIELLNRPASQAIGEPLGLPQAQWVLVVGFEDNAPSVAWQLQRLASEIPHPPVIRSDQQPASTTNGNGNVIGSASLWAALADYPAASSASFTLKAGLPPSGLLELVGALSEDRWAIQAHAGSGILYAHLLAPWDEERMPREIASLRHMAARHRGHVTILRCPAQAKKALRVWGDAGDDWALMRKIKQTIDPGNILNPGRLFDVD